MKAILLSLLVLGFQSTVLASPSDLEGKYAVKQYTWCNGPLGSSTAGCWQYGWNRVSLIKLKDVVIDRIQNIFYLTLNDLNGQTWSSNFIICNANNQTTCNAKYSNGNKTLTIKFGDIDNSLTLVIENSEISLFVWAGVQSSYITFDFIKN